MNKKNSHLFSKCMTIIISVILLKIIFIVTLDSSKHNPEKVIVFANALHLTTFFKNSETNLL